VQVGLCLLKEVGLARHLKTSEWNSRLRRVVNSVYLRVHVDHYLRIWLIKSCRVSFKLRGLGCIEVFQVLAIYTLTFLGISCLILQFLLSQSPAVVGKELVFPILLEIGVHREQLLSLVPLFASVYCHLLLDFILDQEASFWEQALFTRQVVPVPRVAVGLLPIFI